MTLNLIYALISVVIVSLASLVWLLTFWIKNERLEKLLIYMVSFSAWALMWDVFYHLLPELSEGEISAELSWTLILWGIVMGLFIEKVIHWNHCHHAESKNHPHPLAIMNLVWDFFHNFIDGVIIWASFLINTTAGLSTSLAVLFHEIPQEMWDFAVLVHWWYKKGKAILMNFLTALSAVLWVVLAFILWGQIEGVHLYLIPVSIGMFIYIAGSDLIPEINKHNQKLFVSLLQILMFILWSAVMFVLLFLE